MSINYIGINLDWNPWIVNENLNLYVHPIKLTLHDLWANLNNLIGFMETPEERVAVVEYLRNQCYGNKGSPRFQRVARLIKRSSR